MILKLIHNKLYLLLLIPLASCSVRTSFTDHFDRKKAEAIVETGKMAESTSTDWWLNSGGYLYLSDGVAQTVQGKLSDNDHFRILYAKDNARDTDEGYKPQNLIRLVTRAKFKNFTQQVRFKINRINLSQSPNRNQSNGILFFHRYKDGANLYYAGIRVDGYAVIKKKLNGQYYLLKTAPVFPGSYDRNAEPNLMPTERWLGLKTEIATRGDGHVEISVYLKDESAGDDWKKVLQAEDQGSDAERILDEGYAGIRTDFMDVAFDDYAAQEN